jgi:hypothetical protein
VHAFLSMEREDSAVLGIVKQCRIERPVLDASALCAATIVRKRFTDLLTLAELSVLPVMWQRSCHPALECWKTSDPNAAHCHSHSHGHNLTHN